MKEQYEIFQQIVSFNAIILNKLCKSSLHVIINYQNLNFEVSTSPQVNLMPICNGREKCIKFSLYSEKRPEIDKLLFLYSAQE